MTSLLTRMTRIFEEGHGKPLEGLLSDEKFASGKTTPAAVLIAVTDRPEPGAILTRRTDSMRSHPGQVAFPGGRLDAGEDAIAAALREAHEELAMHPSQVQIIGASDPYVTGTGYTVTPVLAVTLPDLPLVANPAEVDSWFEVPLHVLFDRRNYRPNTVFWKGADRTYYEMEWDGYRIWGVTAAIIANLSRRMALTELFFDPSQVRSL